MAQEKRNPPRVSRRASEIVLPGGRDGFQIAILRRLNQQLFRTVRRHLRLRLIPLLLALTGALLGVGVRP